ncbi:MAG TPA: arabinofuranosidase catalytic domain-containing protein, partial [Pseudonocardiaceae bacterium]|nr:arabinofuranosidase catalytic domain-containing protein [Pseudonocardiaceae bacterium]
MGNSAFRARRSFRTLSRIAVATVVVLGGATGAAITAGSAQAATQGPCDLYAAGGTPCVAAHSTTRALYGAYNGPLYQVRRASDNTTRDIGVLSAGGYANAAAQDSFCAGTTCLITIIYDQSGRANNLTQAPAGGAAGGPDNLANATAAPTTLNGNRAYGVFVAPGTGYRDNHTNGIATGDQPEGEYAIFDGTHYNGGCCFDYGNAETNSNDDGNGTMEAIYFGNIRVWGYGTGNGPWIMADMENGLYSGVNAGYNANDPTINYRYTTAIIKGGANQWAIRGGNAQSGGLSTFYSGPRPNVAGYNPMRKQGAIILGTGGDNSKGSDGTFYEGVMTSGYPSDATENAVQANIVAAGYGTGGSTGGGGGALHAVGAGKCLDVPNSTTTAGTQTQIWDCDGSTGQAITHTTSNQLTLYNGADCLDANG